MLLVAPMLLESIGYKQLLLWHGRGHRFDPDQVHQSIQQLSESAGKARFRYGNVAAQGTETGILRCSCISLADDSWPSGPVVSMITQSKTSSGHWPFGNSFSGEAPNAVRRAGISP